MKKQRIIKFLIVNGRMSDFHAHGPYTGIPWWVWLIIIALVFLFFGAMATATGLNLGVNLAGIGALILFVLMLIGGILLLSWIKEVVVG